MRTPLTKKLRFDILHRDNFQCAYCGLKAPAVYLQVDHIVPVGQGGTDAPSNLTASCIPCNKGKSDTMLAPFKRLGPVNHTKDQLTNSLDQWRRLGIDYPVQESRRNTLLTL